MAASHLTRPSPSSPSIVSVMTDSLAAVKRNNHQSTEVEFSTSDSSHNKTIWLEMHPHDQTYVTVPKNTKSRPWTKFFLISSAARHSTQTQCRDGDWVYLEPWRVSPLHAAACVNPSLDTSRSDRPGAGRRSFVCDALR